MAFHSPGFDAQHTGCQMTAAGCPRADMCIQQATSTHALPCPEHAPALLPQPAEPSDGWVSGIVPKTSIDARCPPDFSAKTCKACLGTKNPELCVSCVKSTNTLDATSKCATCASLPTAEGAAACVKCAGAAGSDCARCLDVDCDDTDCLNKRNEDASKAPNLASVDRCFACHGADSSKAVACFDCFSTWTVAKEARGTCLSCVASSSPAAASGCAGCSGKAVSDKSKCLDCLKRAKNQADGAGCGSCSSQADARPHEAACHACVLGSPDDGAKALCSNLEAGSSAGTVADFYKCLAGAKGSDAPNNCEWGRGVATSSSWGRGCGGGEPPCLLVCRSAALCAPQREQHPLPPAMGPCLPARGKVCGAQTAPFGLATPPFTRSFPPLLHPAPQAGSAPGWATPPAQRPATRASARWAPATASTAATAGPRPACRRRRRRGASSA